MKILIIVIISFVLITVSYAQFNLIPLNVDYASFKGNSDKSFTEFYLSFYQLDLEYEQSDSIFVSRFSHHLKIMKDDSVLYNISRNYKSTSTSEEQKLNNQFVDVFPVELKAGEYSVIANISDKIANRTGEYILNATIPDLNSELSISNIELANSFDAKGDSSNFSLKNNIKLIPNASKTYTVINPVLYFYFEAYNLTIDEEGKSNYSYNYYISDDTGKRIRDYPAKEKNGFSTIAEVGGINVVTLEAKSYFFNINLIDNLNNKSISTHKRFSIYKPQREKTSATIAAKIDGYEEYVNYNMEELDLEFDQIKYISSIEEVELYEQLVDAESKKRYLSKFWKQKDPDPSTPINEYKVKYFENLQIVNNNFSTYFKEGWKTDRGRVLLIYDRPDEIERNPSTIDSQPYEIWYYYSLEGGSEFIFADLSGNGNYELLHSTFRNEIKDPDWRIRIQKLKSRGYDPGIDRF